MRFLRFDRPGITGLMPFFLREFRNELLSYALSPSNSLMPSTRLTHAGPTVQSAVLPGVRIKTNGRHNLSAIARILLFRPPFVTPIACSEPPLFRRQRSGVL